MAQGRMVACAHLFRSDDTNSLELRRPPPTLTLARSAGFDSGTTSDGGRQDFRTNPNCDSNSISRFKRSRKMPDKNARNSEKQPSFPRAGLPRIQKLRNELPPPNP